MCYSYKPLRIRAAVRLIKILPNKVDDKVVCILDQLDQAEAPPYCAVSYVWGDPTLAGSIYLGDHLGAIHLHPLHKSLLEFLRCMWEQRMFDRFFWTDSLCLNQMDKSEKSQQVPRMADIYVNADKTICWLGHEPVIEKKMRIVQYWHTIVKWNMLGIEDSKTPGPIYKMKRNRVSNAAKYLLNLPYFSRVWIVQEVALSRRALITCGSVSLDLDTFREKIHEFRHGFLWSMIWSLCELRARKGKMPLWLLIGEFYACKSSLAVDKVYGVLGLVEESEKEISDRVEVNYEKTVLEVFWDTVFECRAPWDQYVFALAEMEAMFKEEQAGRVHKPSIDLGDYIKSHRTSDRHVMFAEIVLRVFEAERIFIRDRRRAYPEWDFDIWDIFQEIRSPVGEQPELQSAAAVGLSLRSWIRNMKPKTGSNWRNQEPLDPSWEWQRIQRKDEETGPIATSGRISNLNIGIKLTTPVPETVCQSYLAGIGGPINFQIKSSSFQLVAALDTEHGPSKSWSISLKTFIESHS